jgi:RNA polymerase sigma-70 factor (ECF subfamily)
VVKPLIDDLGARVGVWPRPASPADAAGVAVGADAESERWCRRLEPGAGERDAAIAELYALLHRAARFEVHRRAARSAPLGGEELEDLATQAADDALVAVLAKLHTYRGASRFTTWAYKFAILEAGVKTRRQAWHGREVVLADDTWALHESTGPTPASGAESAELLRALAAAARSDLTRHQREVLIALAVDGVPIDVLAERLNTTRGALYKTLHDARRKLRSRLTAAGLLPTSDHAGSDA